MYCTQHYLLSQVLLRPSLVSFCVSPASLTVEVMAFCFLQLQPVTRTRPLTWTRSQACLWRGSSGAVEPPSQPSSWRSWREPSNAHTTPISTHGKSWLSGPNSLRPEFRLETRYELKVDSRAMCWPVMDVCYAGIKLPWVVAAHSSQPLHMCPHVWPLSPHTQTQTRQSHCTHCVWRQIPIFVQPCAKKRLCKDPKIDAWFRKGANIA